ncbi:hypothetical protein DRN85_06155 [Methanosarcinales archaeon]|nr:MAG: hypothetical protein DRN85_06155 [Methanosarcinales archaeon]
MLTSVSCAGFIFRMRAVKFWKRGDVDLTNPRAHIADRICWRLLVMKTFQECLTPHELTAPGKQKRKILIGLG